MNGRDSVRAWVVVGAAFAGLFTVFGVTFSFGAFFVPISAEFGTGKAAASVVFSLTALMYFTLGAASGPGLSKEEKEHLNGVWHRLQPWRDSVAGLSRLKTSFMLVTLSNGNVRLLVDMAKNAGLPGTSYSPPNWYGRTSRMPVPTRWSLTSSC